MQNQLSKSKKIITLATASLISLAAFLCLAPTLKTHATENQLPINVSIDPVLSITNSAENLSTKLEDVDTLYSLSTDINVYTNNLTGYTLSMSDPDGNSLRDDTVSTTIPSITSPLTISTEVSFPTNKWAYTKSPLSNENASATYNPLPTDTSVNLTVTEEPLETSITSVTFSAKIDNNLPAGAYRDIVYFTAVANLVPGRLPFFTTEYMQDFTEEICNTVDTPTADVTTVTQSNGIDYVVGGTIVPSTTVKDKRDNQIYTVRKLADGNCWMTENLRYGANTDGSINTDLATASNITSADTDSPASSFQVTAIDNATSDFATWANSYATPRINIYNANQENAADASYNTTKFGVLYNYCAATAGNACTTSSTAPTKTRDGDGDGTNESISGSICPKSWELPTFAINGYDATSAVTNGSISDYANLRNVYSIAGNSTGNYLLISKPLDFIHAGDVNSASLIDRGSGGYYWSATPIGNNSAYRLGFYSSYVGKNELSRTYGFSVRCVLKGAE